MTAKCVVCSRPVNGAYLCWDCEGKLEQRLAEMPALFDDLELAITRQTVMGPQSEGRAAETAVAVNMVASEVEWCLWHTLSVWAADLGNDRAIRVPTLSRWLLRRLNRVRQFADVGQMYDEIEYAVREAERVVLGPKNRSRVKVAECLNPSCDGELWALIPTVDYVAADEATHGRITCTECDAVFPAVEWQRLGKRIRKASDGEKTAA